MIEVWRAITDFEAYEVSSLGRVRRRVNGMTGAKAGLVLKPWRSASGKGYLTITLCADGKKPRRAVHILVCAAFHGPRPSPKHQAAHGNGNLLDCREDNLRWALPTENAADRIMHGTANRGERHGMAKLSDASAQFIRETPRERASNRELAAVFGVSDSLISMVRRNRIRSYV